MLIDINAYIGHWPFRQLKGGEPVDLLKRMNSFGVMSSVISNLHGIFYKDTHRANEELYEILKANQLFQQRFIPFAVMNPLLPSWRTDLDECNEIFGMQGIRLYPTYHMYNLDARQTVELVRAASDRNMVIAIPQRMIDPRQRSWMDVREGVDMDAFASLVRQVPDAKYMILDTRRAGRISSGFHDIVKNANVLFDTTRSCGVPITGFSSESLHYLLDTYGSEKIAFGTGTPFIDYCSPFIRIESFEEADEGIKEMIWSGNASRMLNL